MGNSRYSRKDPFRQSKEEVLVVCGGQTERIYFDTLSGFIGIPFHKIFLLDFYS
jgi:hypothetical protein